MALLAAAFVAVSGAAEVGTSGPGDSSPSNRLMAACSLALAEQGDYVPSTVTIHGRSAPVQVAGRGPFVDGVYLVPVFGDIHGNLGGLLSATQQLQRETGVKFPHVLQVGDFGYYPHGEANDGSSRKATNQPDYHDGVQRFLNDPEVRGQMLAARRGCELEGCRVYFIRGNHEDHRALSAFAGRSWVPVSDGSLTLNYLPDGAVVSLRLAPGVSVTVGAFGGIDPASRPGSAQRNPGIAFDDAAADPLLAQSGGIDVLLTHQGPDAALRGSRYVDAMVELVKPQVHLHGHSHQRLANTVNGTPSFGLERIPNERRPRPAGFVGFLRVFPDGRVDFVFADGR
jgi:predicted phosphodiesterase